MTHRAGLVAALALVVTALAGTAGSWTITKSDPTRIEYAIVDPSRGTDKKTAFILKPTGRNTRTCDAFNSESRIGLTPAARSASTMHRGSGPFSSGPTYIDTCDHVDPVRRFTSAATRVLPSLSRTSPRSSIAASDCGSVIVAERLGLSGRPR